MWKPLATLAQWGAVAVVDKHKVFKLPRHLLAIIANDNHQAIKALESLEIQVGQTLPEQVEILQKAVEALTDELHGAYAVALQALAVAENAKNAHQTQGYLGAVAVGVAEGGYLVGVPVV